MKKNIYIVTVYNSLNPGSFLQASSLYNSLASLGYQVCFLKTGARSLIKQTFLSVVFMFKQRKFADIIPKIKMGFAFAKQLKDYYIADAQMKENEIYILGSDEIWNVARRDMAAYPIFWGGGLALERCISYAPSLNNTTAEQLKQYEYAYSSLEKMYSISVRDSYSKKVLQEITDREIAVVCDPTVLLSADEYKKKVKVCPDKGYILIYIYNRAVSQEDIDAIITFAKHKGKKLISFGSVHKWCDKNVKGTAYDFLMYINHADYVCTSTFHGTMFSAIFHKQFAVLGTKNRKVSELLDVLELERRASKETLRQVLEADYDHQKLSNRLDELRQAGLKYLQNSIEML